MRVSKTASEKAKDVQLNGLHSTVAMVLNEQVGYKDKDITYDENGDEVEGVERFSASPATLAAAIKFLKDNSITCDIAQEENLDNLRSRLGNKSKHSDSAGLGDPRVAAKVTPITG